MQSAHVTIAFLGRLPTIGFKLRFSSAYYMATHDMYRI